MAGEMRHIKDSIIPKNRKVFYWQVINGLAMFVALLGYFFSNPYFKTIGFCYVIVVGISLMAGINCME